MVYKRSQSAGERIRFVRKHLGLSMEEFGKKFSPPASKGVVSNWENNYNLPNNKRLQRIAELGEVSVLYILEGRFTMDDTRKAKDVIPLHDFVDSFTNQTKDDFLTNVSMIIEGEKHYSPDEIASLQSLFLLIDEAKFDDTFSKATANFIFELIDNLRKKLNSQEIPTDELLSKYSQILSILSNK